MKYNALQRLAMMNHRATKLNQITPANSSKVDAELMDTWGGEDVEDLLNSTVPCERTTEELFVNECIAYLPDEQWIVEEGHNKGVIVRAVTRAVGKVMALLCEHRGRSSIDDVRDLGQAMRGQRPYFLDVVEYCYSEPSTSERSSCGKTIPEADSDYLYRLVMNYANAGSNDEREHEHGIAVSSKTRAVEMMDCDS